jgi:hypothetical protein
MSYFPVACLDPERSRNRESARPGTDKTDRT